MSNDSDKPSEWVRIYPSVRTQLQQIQQDRLRQLHKEELETIRRATKALQDDVVPE